MSFNATTFNVIIALLMAFTLFVAGMRMTKPLDTNWPVLYWIIMTVFSFRYAEDSFDPRIIMIGLGAGLLLRFEFLGRIVANLLKIVEVCVWAYVLYMGLLTVTV